MRKIAIALALLLAPCALAQVQVSTGGGSSSTTINGAGTAATDNSGFTTSTTMFTPAGGVYNDSIAALISGQMATFRMNAYRGLYVVLSSGGAEIGTAGSPVYVNCTNCTGGGGGSVVNIADPTTPTQKLAVDATGKIGINNFPASQAVTNANLDAALSTLATQSTLALIKAKTDNIDVALSTRTKPSDAQLVVGPTPAASASTTDPVQIGGVDNAGTVRKVLVSSSGSESQGTSTTLSDGQSNVAVMAAGTGGNANPMAVMPFLFNGTNWDRWRGDATNGAFVNVKSSVGLTVTANAGTNLNTSALALDATLTGGNAISIFKSGAKGTTAAALVTSENVDANTQALHVFLKNTSIAVTGTFWQSTQPVSIAATVTTDVSDRSARLLGHAILDAGAATIGSIANTGFNVNNFPSTYDTSDRAARLLGIVYGSQGQQLKQTATNFNLQSELFTGGTAYDARQIRVLTSSDVVDVSDRSARLLGHIVCDSGCGGAASFADSSAFTFATTAVNNMSAVVDDVSTNTVAENSAGALRMNTNRILYVDLSKTGANTNKILVTPDSVALPANQSVNLSQVNGTTTSTGNGATDAGTTRVTLSNDSTGVVKLATGSNTIGAISNTGFNVNNTPAVTEASLDATIVSDAATTAPTKELAVSGKTNDGTPQFRFFPLGTGGRSVIIEGFAGGTGVPVTGTFWQSTQPVSLATNTPDVTDRAARLLGVVYGSQGQQLKQTATNFNLQSELAVGGTLIDPRLVTLQSGSTTTVTQTTGTNLHTVTDSGSTTAITQSDTTTGSTALGALNAAISIALAGQAGAGFQLAAGTLIGTLTPELSYDGGTSWVATSFYDPATNSVSPSIVFTASNTAVQRTIVAGNGVSNARVRVSAFTSGTANATARATTSDGQMMFVSMVDGIKATYHAATSAQACVASTTGPCFTIYGSATKTVRINYIHGSCTAATAAIGTWLVNKYSTAQSAGTSTTMTAVPLDTNDPASTATALNKYTAAPTAGTLVGTVSTTRGMIGSATVVGTQWQWIYGQIPAGHDIILRGTAQGIGIINTIAGSCDFEIEWTEE